MADSPAGSAMAAYVARLIALRRAHPVLRCGRFLHGEVQPAPGIADIAWFGEDGEAVSVAAWNDPGQRPLVLRRAMAGEAGRVDILTLLLNPTGEARDFRLPPPHRAGRILLDSAAPDAKERDVPGAVVPVGAHSAVLVHAEYQETGEVPGTGRADE